MKFWKKWMLVSAAALMLGGCGETPEEPVSEPVEESVVQAVSSEEEAVQESTAVTFTDALGREITVERPERVAALIGSFTDVWMTAGGQVVACAGDSWENFNLDLAEDCVNLGSILEPDYEALIAAKPDFVIASAGTKKQVEALELLENAGLNVAYFDVSSFSEYLHMLEICTAITGREDLYREKGLEVQQEIQATLERVDGSAPKVLFLRASASNVKAKGNSDTVLGEMLQELGCVNIAEDGSALSAELSLEAILVENPDYIFVVVQGSDEEAAMKQVEELLTSSPVWSALSAVQQNHYYVLDKALYHLKPNARWGEAYRKLADILYPAE